MKLIIIYILLSFGLSVDKNGTTSATFLEIDIGGEITCMGGAGVSHVDDASSTYWNPAGLAFSKKNQLFFMNQSWIAGIQHSYSSVSVPINRLGTIGLSINLMNYGETEVTSLDFQDGTGDYYSALDYSVSFSYARKFVNWFGFGTSIKYIGSKIWHTSASAFAMDLGAQIYTDFLSSKKGKHDGLKIGMSISNYGTKIKYDGLDLIQPIDPSDDYGNYGDVMGKYETSSWELPLIFRLGLSNDFIKSKYSSLIIAFDAIHPNNDKERFNIGIKYSRINSQLFNYYVGAGYKGIHMKIREKNEKIKIQFSSEFGPSFGAGMSLPIQNKLNLKFDYTLRFVGVFGIMKLATLSLEF